MKKLMFPFLFAMASIQIAGGATYQQNFGSSVYQSITIYKKQGSSVTHTFKVNGVIGNSLNSFRTDWYSTQDIQGPAGYIESDSSNAGNGYWDPSANRTFSSAGTHYARGEIMTRDFVWQSFWWKETHQWRVTVIDDTTGPTTPGTPDLSSSDDSGYSSSDNITRHTSGLTFSWSGSTDNGTGLAGYEYRTDSGSWVWRGNNTSVSISAGHGSHTFDVRAKDNAGNYSSYRRLSFTVDTVAPGTPSLSSPANGSQTTDHTPYLNWENVSGAVRYFLHADDGAFDIVGNGDRDEYVSGSGYQYTQEMQEDTWNWRVYSEDAAGNKSGWSSTRSFTVVDGSPPSVPSNLDFVAGDDTGYSNSDNITKKTTGLTFSWSVSSDTGQSGVDGYEYRTDSGSWVWRGNNTSVSISAGHGSHTFDVRAKDNAGNYSSYRRLSFTVDTIAPSAPSLSSPSNGSQETDHTPYLNWGSVSGTHRYFLHVDDGWGDIIGAGDRDEYVSSSGYQYTQDMQEDTWNWNVKSEDAAGNQSGWSSEWSFEVVGSGNIQATLNKQDGITPTTASLTKFILYTSPAVNNVGQNPYTFTGIVLGSYWVEGYHKNTAFPSDPYEYWGSVQASLTSHGQTKQAIINRHTPYCEDFWFEYNGSRVDATNKVLPGATVTAKAVVRNNDPNAGSRNVHVSMGWRYGSGSTVATYVSPNEVISKNNTHTFTFGPFNLSAGVEGDLYAYVKTEAYFSNWALTDSWDWTKKFEVTTGSRPDVSNVTLRDLDGQTVTALTPGKRYVVTADFTDADGEGDLTYCVASLINSADGREIALVYDTRTGAMGVGSGGVPQLPLPLQDNYAYLTHVEKQTISNGYRVRYIFWLTAKWAASTDGVDVIGRAYDAASHQTDQRQETNLDFAPLSLPDGKWTVIVHGKSSATENWFNLGSGPRVWGNSMSDWYRLQSEPAIDREWMWEMANKLRTLSTNEVRIHRVKNREFLSLQTWIGDGANGSYSSEYLPTTTGHNILLFDWDEPSDFADLSEMEDDWYAYGTADALYALIVREADKNVNTLIGYSRGGIVVSETARRLLRDGHPGIHVVLLDAEGEGGPLVSYPDSEFHAWSNTRTDIYRSRDGTEYSHGSGLVVLGGNALPEPDGNDRTVNDWPAYSLRSGMIGHSNYPSYFTEWNYLTTDVQYGQVLVTPQVYRDDNGPQTIQYASTLNPTTPDNYDGKVFNGGFDHGSVAGWTYHGGLTPFGDEVYLSWSGYRVEMGPLGVGDELPHNWLVAPDAATHIRFTYWTDMLLAFDDMAVGVSKWNDASGTTSYGMPIDRYWIGDNFSSFTATLPFTRRGTPGRFTIGTYDIEVTTIVSVDDAEFIEASVPVVGTLNGTPNPLVQGANLNLVAGGVVPGDNPITQVSFYRDSNGNGVYDSATDALFGVAYSGSGGNWQITKTTAGIPLGQHYFFALAKDTDGLWSAAVRSASSIDVTQPANQPPEISSLSDSPDPVERGNNVTLTATGVSDSDGGTVARVEFYHDANNNVVYDSGIDTLLGTDATVASGTASVSVNTSGLPAGTVRFLAVAYDDQGAASAEVSTRCSIIQKWSLAYQVSPVAGGIIAENPSAGSYADGTQIDPTVQAAANYSFDHWEVNGVTKTMPVSLAANSTVKAVFVFQGGGVAPVLNSIGNQSVAVGSPFSLPVTKQQGDTPITWTLESKPTGMTVDGVGAISWPAPTPGGSSHYITVKAQNSAGSDTESFTLYVLAPADTTGPTVQITGPTAAATYTSSANSLNVSGTAADDVGVVQVAVKNNRAIGEWYCSGTASWSMQSMPLYQGLNYITATATDSSGNIGSDELVVNYTGDSRYNDVLFSGALVQEIGFPDNLTPGQTVTVQWRVLSYLPLRVRLGTGSKADGWMLFKNAAYTGSEQSPWNIGGRHATVYSYQSSYTVPAKSGDFSAWFNAAQTDGNWYMACVVPDGVDGRPDLSQSKLITRTIAGGGTDTDPQSDASYTDLVHPFETFTQGLTRSGGTVININVPTAAWKVGQSVTCEWTVLAYLPVFSKIYLINLDQQKFWLSAVGTQVSEQNSSWRFGGTYAKEYKFRATFTVPAQVGAQQMYFLNRQKYVSGSTWMAGNIPAGMDSRPVLYNGMYGRFIERDIVNP